MKVVINKCFGGFNLSNAAIKECIKRGMKVTTYNEEGNYTDEDADFVDSKKEDSWRYGCCNKHRNEFRTNPIVVAVVEEMGKKADGPCAKLKVIDIPFETCEGWHVDEYDGMESIKENHREWY